MFLIIQRSQRSSHGISPETNDPVSPAADGRPSARRVQRGNLIFRGAIESHFYRRVKRGQLRRSSKTGSPYSRAAGAEIKVSQRPANWNPILSGEIRGKRRRFPLISVQTPHSVFERAFFQQNSITQTANASEEICEV